MVERIAPFCGSAKCSRHNFVFLEGVKAALTADAACNEGWYKEKPREGLRAMARVYAGWGFSQAFLPRSGSTSRRLRLSPRSRISWSCSGKAPSCSKDANNLLAMLWTWQNGDISDNELYDGRFQEGVRAPSRPRPM